MAAATSAVAAATWGPLEALEASDVEGTGEGGDVEEAEETDEEEDEDEEEREASLKFPPVEFARSLGNAIKGCFYFNAAST